MGAWPPNFSRNSAKRSLRELAPGRVERSEPLRPEPASVELCDQLGDRCVPRDGLIVAAAASAAPLERLNQPIGVIRDLDRRLAARTQRALADRMRRVAFELLREAHRHHAALSVTDDVGVALHHAHGRAAAGAADRADAVFEFGDPRRQIFVGHEANELVLGAARRAGRDRRGSARDGGELDERSAIHRHF